MSRFVNDFIEQIDVNVANDSERSPANPSPMWRLEDMERRIASDLPYALAIVEAFSFVEWE